jgi:hypothetical protein
MCPCLHAGVPAFAETLRASRRFGTQAWTVLRAREIKYANRLACPPQGSWRRGQGQKGWGTNTELKKSDVSK